MLDPVLEWYLSTSGNLGSMPMERYANTVFTSQLIKYKKDPKIIPLLHKYEDNHKLIGYTVLLNMLGIQIRISPGTLLYK